MFYFSQCILIDLIAQLYETQRKNSLGVLQSSETSVKQKSEIISRFEEKTNQMAATIKQLEHR